MTIFSRLLLTAILTILSIVAGLYIFVYLIFDPENLRLELYEAASRKGYEIKIDGPLQTQVLPSPAITANDVKWGSLSTTGHLEELTLSANWIGLIGLWKNDNNTASDLDYLRFISGISIQNGSLSRETESNYSWQIDKIQLISTDISFKETDFPVQLNFRFGQAIETDAQLMVSVDPMFQIFRVSDLSASIGTAQLKGSLSINSQKPSSNGRFELSGLDLKQIVSQLHLQFPMIKVPVTSSTSALTNININVAFDLDMFGSFNVASELSLDGNDFSLKASKGQVNENLKISVSGNRWPADDYFGGDASDLGKIDPIIFAPLIPLINRPEQTQIEIDFQTLVLANTEVKNLYTNIFTNGGVLQLASLNADLLGGQLDASGKFDFITEKPEFIFKTSVSGINILRMLEKSLSNTSLSGILGFEMILKSPSDLRNSAKPSLFGDGRFTLKELNYPDLNVENIFCDLNQIFTGNQSERKDIGIGAQFSDLEGHFSVYSDEIVLSQISTTAGNFKITADGIVKLASKDFRFNVTSLLTETLTSEDGCPVVSQLRNRDIPLICEGNIGQNTSLTCNPDMKAIGGGLKSSIIKKFGRKTMGSELEKGINLLEVMEQLFD
ncbi:MAG: hypothetical protein CMK43_11265 [Porticoccaceae bacterium]|nr:hypothetical protein [Porticoccaceae bacterium]